MTDNGPTPARFNSGLRGLKGTVYEGGIRVPFFLRWPGTVKAGTKIDRLAAHIDLFPTLLDMCGVHGAPGPQKIDGTSLLPLLRDPEASHFPSDRTLYFQWHRGDRGELYRSCAALTQRYKLVNGKELYDLATDPGESHDIAAQFPDRVAAMRSGYEAWFHDVEGTRHFEPPRIFLGTESENPVLLTRQDWRGPMASWEPGGLGYWQVDVRTAGTYECTLLFPALASAGQASVRLGGASAQTAVAEGSASATVRLSGVSGGPSRVEAELAMSNQPPTGPHYVRIRRL
jgi:hypothetical protein